eukprot:5117180-Prorocentrum_lima.AAC.1
MCIRDSRGGRAPMEAAVPSGSHGTSPGEGGAVEGTIASSTRVCSGWASTKPMSARRSFAEAWVMCLRMLNARSRE